MNAQVRRLILESDNLPWGEQCSATLAEAITLADSLGEQQWAYAARMRLAQNAAVMSNQKLLVSTFAICEQWHHDDPGTFPLNPADMGPAGEGYVFADLAWLWKSVIGVLERSLNFSSQMVDRALEDMAELYRSEGLGLAAVHQRRLDRALSRRDVTEIRRERSILASLGSDDHADCPACTSAQLICAALFTGEDRLALTLLDRMLADGQRCVDEPASVLSLVLDLIATDDQGRRVPTAVSEILKSPTVARLSPAPTARLAVLVSRCGHHERALAMIRSVIGRIEDNPTDHAAAELLWACLAKVCRTAPPAFGHQELPELDTDALRTALDAPSGPLTVSRVADLAETLARDLSRRFDARNGTDGHHRRVADILAPHTYDLDLELVLAAASPQDIGGCDTLFRIDDPSIDEPETIAQAQEYADTLLRLDHDPQLVRAMAEQWATCATGMDRIALDVLRARACDVQGFSLDAARILSASAEEMATRGYRDLAVALRHYPASLHAPGESTLWERIVGNLPALARQSGAAAAGLVASWHEELISPQLWDDADRWLAVAHRELPVASWRDQSMAARLRLAVRRIPSNPDLAWLTETPTPSEQSPLTAIARHQALATIALARRDVEAAYRHVLAATRVHARWAKVAGRARQVEALAQAAADAGRRDEVMVTTDHLLALCEQLPDPERRLRILGVIRALIVAELPDRALPLATDLLAELADQPRTLLRAQVLEALGRAQALTRLHTQGARTLLQAADLLDELGQSTMSRRTAIRAAEECLRSGDPHSAGRIVERLIDTPHPTESPTVLVDALYIRAESATRLHDADPHSVAAVLSQALNHDLSTCDAALRDHHRAKVLALWARWEVRRGEYASAFTHAEEGLAVCPPSVDTIAGLQQTMAKCLHRMDPEANYDRIRELMTRIADDPSASPDVRQEGRDWLQRHSIDPR